MKLNLPGPGDAGPEDRLTRGTEGQGISAYQGGCSGAPEEFLRAR